MPVTRRVVRPTAPAIKRRMRAAAEKLGVPIPAGYADKRPWCGKPARDLAALLAKQYGLKSGQLITAELLRRISVTLGDAATPGAAAYRWLDENRAYEDWRNNRSALIDAWWKEYDADFVGQPWCGLAVWKAYKDGAGVDLRDAGVVYTPGLTASIYAKHVVTDKSGKRFALGVVSPFAARPGDIVLFDWSSAGFGASSTFADHVGLVRAAARNGVLPTLEGNTQPGSSGDQSGHGGGDGVYERERDLRYVLTVATLIPLN